MKSLDRDPAMRSPVEHVQSSVTARVSDVLGDALEIGGEFAGGIVRAAGRGVRGFVRRLFH